MAKITMDTYQARFEKAKKNREERFRNLNANYKPGSPLFLEERNKIRSIANRGSCFVIEFHIL